MSDVVPFGKELTETDNSNNDNLAIIICTGSRSQRYQSLLYFNIQKFPKIAHSGLSENQLIFRKPFTWFQMTLILGCIVHFSTNRVYFLRELFILSSRFFKSSTLLSCDTFCGCDACTLLELEPNEIWNWQDGEK